MTIERLRFTEEEAPLLKEDLSNLADIMEEFSDRIESLQPGVYDITTDNPDYKRQLRVLRDGTGILGPSNSPAVRANPHNPLKEAQRLDKVGDIFLILSASSRSITELIWYDPEPTQARTI